MSGDNKISFKRIGSGLIWSFAERISAQMVSLIVSVILARILDPEHYGAIAIVMIFISICNIFVTDGFGVVLVQRKEADLLDFNTMFWASASLSVILYLLLFGFAPVISNFYQMPDLEPVLKVLGIRIILTSWNTIQQAYIQKRMEFKKFFVATLFGTVASAVVGIAMALSGYGIWALAMQYLTNTTIDTIILNYTCGWCPKLQFSWSRLKVMLPFSFRVFGKSVSYSIKDNLRSILIGKKYTSSDLAFYNKGQQFPQLIIINLNTAIGKVMFPSAAASQDDKVFLKQMVRRAISVGTYIIVPIMLGFLAIGDTFISILLTDKWLPAVPYLRIFCLAYLTRPFDTTCSSTIMAMGHSEIALKNEIIIDTVSILTLILAVFVFDNVFLIAVGMLVCALVSVVLHSWYISKLIDFKVKEQLKDMLPIFGCSVMMALVVLALNNIPVNKGLLLILQTIIGAGCYIGLSIVFKIDSFQYLKQKLLSLKRLKR